MSIRCNNCGAFYRGSVSPYQKFVKCQHCGSVIQITKNEENKGRKVLIRETVVEPEREFKMDEFAAFLAKRGIKTFDSVSGILQLGLQQVCVNGEGSVEGPEPLKLRVEKWVQDFMSS
jgi:phage FluMu protein Com